MLIGLHVQIHAQYGERGRLEIDQLFEQLCGSGFPGERILGVDWFSGSRHGFGQLTRLLQRAECQRVRRRIIWLRKCGEVRGASRERPRWQMVADGRNWSEKPPAS